MGHNTTILAGATSSGSLSGTDPVSFFATADDATVNVATIIGILNNGTGFVVDTQASGAQAGDLTVSAAINKTAGGTATLRLVADHDLIVNQQIAGTAGAFFLNLTTNGTNAAGGVLAINAALASNGGSISLTNNRVNSAGITLNANVDAGASLLLLNSQGGAISQTAGAITAGTLTVANATTIALAQATNAIATLGSIFTLNSVNIVDGSGGLTLTSSVHANAGTASIGTTGDLVTDGFFATVFGAASVALTATGAMSIGGRVSTLGGANAIGLTAAAGLTFNGADAEAAGILTANADSNADGTGTFTINNAGVSIIGTTIDITAADVALGGAIQATNVVLRPSQTTATIGVGGAGSFAVSSAELGAISANATVTIGSASNTGGITIGGTEVVSAPNLNLALITGGAISVNATRGLSAASLVMTADSMALNGGTLAVSGIVTLRPLTAGQLIKLGSADVAGTLGLTNAELATISASLLKIGSSTAGDITMTSPIALNNNTVLETGGSISQSATVQGNLGMRAVTDITLNNPANNFGTVAASVTGGMSDVRITDSAGSALNIGTVGDVTGISGQSGFVAVTAGAVTVNSAVNATGGFITITANGAAGGSVSVYADVVNATGFTTINANETIVGTGTIGGPFVRLSAGAGIGVDGTGFVKTDADFLRADNTTTSNVAVVQADSVTLDAFFRNQALSGALSLRTLNGSIDTGFAIVSANNGQITLTAGDTGAGASILVSSDVTSDGGNIRLFSADAIVLAGNVNAGSGNVTLEANSTNAIESVADNSGSISGVNSATVTGNVVTLKSASSLSVKTTASTIAATNTVSGNITVVEADGASFSATNVGSGTISLTTTSGVLTIGAATGTGSGVITLAGAGGINVNAAVTTGSLLGLSSSGVTAINAALSNLGSLATDGAGTTTISGGSITTSGAQTYNDAVTLGAAATLTSTGSAAITFAGTVDAAFDLAVSTAGAASFNGVISGAGKLTQSGSGTTTLAASNLYTGATTLNAGTLLVNGSIVSATTVNNTATLGGTGSTGAVTVAAGGVLSPGASAGTLSTGNVSLASGATLKVELGGTTAGQYDQLNVTGSVTLSGATLDLSLINSFNLPPGSSFTIISNDGADSVNGTFVGLAEGSILSASGKFFSITYHGGSNNNDVVLLTRIPPSITSNGGGATASVLVAENTLLVTSVTATNPEAGTLSYSTVGGADVLKFQIDSVTGALSFAAAPDFEIPADADHNNSYIVQVRASNGALFDDQTLTVNISNAGDTPSITSNGGGATANVSVAENTTAVTTVTATDPDSGTTLTYSIVGGADASKFQINSATGALSFGTAPNFEQPTDADHNNSYVVQVRASDGSLFDDQTLTVGITDQAERSPANDFNHDGRSDILWRQAGGAVAEWLMNGTQVIGNLGIAVPGNDWKFQDTGDFGGDGISDVLWRNVSGQVVLWQMNGNQVVSNTAFPTVSNDYHVQGVADFNGDGKSDVLFRHDSGQVVLWQMNGDQVIANTAIAVPSRQYHIEGVGDFGGDGKADVMFRHDSGQVVLWQMNGDKIAVNTAIQDVPQEYRVQGIGDFNGDGRSDVLWRHDSGQVVLWQMNGDKIVSNTAVGEIPNDYKVADVRDYNGDGKSDVLFRHVSGQVVLWQMNGDQVVSNTAVAVVTNDWVIQAHHYDLL